MACMIHGQSHRAIKHIGEQTAALEVLWIYASRTNHENVAWPGLRGLARDIGRAVGTIQKARQHLVSLEALEEVERYVRPEWRSLEENDRKKRVGMDRSKYYRPTGKIVVNDETIPVFYVPQKEASDLETVPDVSNGRTSTPQNVYAVERLPDDTELSTSSELDSRSTERSTKKDSAVSVEPAQAGTPKPEVSENGEKQKRKPNEWYDFIVTTWGKHEGVNTRMAQMLQGTSKVKGYKEYNFAPAATLGELREWRDWYFWYDRQPDGTYRKRSAVKALSIVGKHGAIQSSVYEFRLWKATQAPPKEEGIVTFTRTPAEMAEELRRFNEEHPLPKASGL